jgi:D-isomer specific 2-hydroxyacid dehydrogenase, catalytic domain
MDEAGIGVDNVDVLYCTSKSIYVANVPLANAVSVAEHTLLAGWTAESVDPIARIIATNIGRF